MTVFSKIIETVVGDKRPWREYKARSKRLPPSYRTAMDGLERYLDHFGTGGDNTAMLLDLVDLFEQSAANGTPVRRIVGEDPVEFVETFLQNYPKGHWVARERARLNDAIARAAGEEPTA